MDGPGLRAKPVGRVVEMIRAVMIASVVLTASAGCGEPPRARVVPVTPAGVSGDGGDAHGPQEKAVTKPPRAIATH
jgi:hypothetical protein